MYKISRMLICILVATLALTGVRMNSVEASSNEKVALIASVHDSIDFAISSINNPSPANNLVVREGQIIRLDVEYSSDGSNEFEFMLLNFDYNSTLVSPMYMFDEFPEFGYKVEPQEVEKRGGFFPHVTVPMLMDTVWTQSVEFKNDIATLIFEPSHQNPPLYIPVSSSGRILSLFFKVNEGVSANDQIDFTFREKGGNPVFTHFTKDKSKEEVLPTVTNASVTVAGEAADENHNIESLKANGIVAGTTYDYLADQTPTIAGNETSYDFAVPADVDKITFDTVFEDPSAGTEIKHSKVNQSGGFISNNLSLEVGDNYFMSVVTSKGATIESYKYKIKRLNNNNYGATGTTDVGETLVFNAQNNYQVDVKGNTTYVDMSGSNDGELAFSSVGGSTVVGNRITVNPSVPQTQFKVVYTPEAWRAEYNNVPGIDASNRGTKLDTNFTLNYLSNNTNISSLKVKNGNGVELGSSNESKDRYEFTVPADTTQVSLDVLFELGAVVSEGNITNVSLAASGSTTIKFKAKALDSTIKEYTVVITKELRDQNDLDSLSVKVDGVEMAPQGPTVTQDIVLDLDYTNIGKSVVLDAQVDPNSGATIVSGGSVNRNLVAGENKFTILVRAEDGTEKTYTVTINVAGNSNSELEDGLKPSDPDTPLEEDKDKESNEDIDGVQTKNLYYNVEVPFSKNTYGKNDLDFTSPEGAQVSFDPSETMDLVVGDNSYKLIILSQDGSTKTIYNITVTRLASSEIEGGIDTDGGDDWLVDPDTPIVGEKDDDQLDEDGIKYDVYRYNIAVKNSKETFGMDDISFTKPDGSTIVGGETPIQLSVGNANVYEFVIISSDGKSHSKYIFTIDRASNSSSQVEGDIKPGDGAEDWLENENDANNPIEDNSKPGEKDAVGDIYRYRINVSYDKKTFDLNDLTFNLPEGAITTGGDLINLEVGDNEFKFVVTSPDKTTQSTYIVTVNRAKNSKSEIEDGIHPEDGAEWPLDPDNPIIPDSDKDTEEEKDGVITKTFNYIINVKNSIDKFDGTKDLVFDIPENANVSYSPAGEFSLAVGDGNQLTITVTSESGKTVTKYVYTIIREASSDSSIDDLGPGSDSDDWLVDPSNPIEEDKDSETDVIDGVTTETFFYTIHVKNSKTSFNGANGADLIYTIPQDSEIVYSHNGEFDLQVGSNSFTMTVTSGDRRFVTKHIYTIIREADTSVDVDVKPEDGRHQIAKNSDYDYTVWVPNGTKSYGRNSFKLTLTEGQTVQYDLPGDLILQDDPDLDKFTFTITAQDGVSKQNYTLHIVILSDEIKVPKLISVSIDGQVVDTFNPDVHNHAINLDDYTLDELDRFIFTSTAEAGITVDPLSIEKLFIKGQASMDQVVTLTSVQGVNFYKFTFTRTLSKDNNLSDIIINDDEGIELTPEFEPNNPGPYEVELPAGSDSITVNPIPNDPNSTVNGGGEIDLVPGDNNVVIKVTPEDGPDKEYNIVVKVELALNELKVGDKEVDVTSGVRVGNTITYKITEPFSSEDVEAYVHAVANHESVTITGQANKDVTLNNQDITFKLTARDGKTVLNVVVEYSRALSSNAKLEVLEANINGQSKIINFDPDVLEYSFTVDAHFDELDRDVHLTMKPQFSKTKISAPNKMSLSNSETTVYIIKTTSEDGSSSLEYKLIITRPANNYIESLFIKDGKGHIEGEFDRNKSNYDAIVYPDNDTFDFGWVTQSGVEIVNESELKGILTSSLPKTIEIKVKGVGEGVRSYFVDVTTAISTRLKSMSSNIGVIDFKPEVNEYTIYVPMDTSQISLVDVVAEDSRATITGNYTNVDLLQDTTTITIKVSNGTDSSKYIVNVKKADDETNIDKIVVNDGPNRWVSTEKDDGSFEVIVNADTDLNDLEIDVILGVPGGNYTISQGTTDEDGNKHFVITVEDKNGVKKDYDLVIKNGLSDNNFLFNLKINGEEITGFNRWNQSYTYKLTDSSFLPIGTPEDMRATVTYEIPENLVDGSEVKVIVTSELGNTRIYTIKIEKEKDNTAILESLSVKQAAFSPKFNKLQNQYYMTVPYELDTLTVIYKAIGNATVTIESNRTVNGDDVSDLEVGDENEIRVVVEAEDGSSYTYTIYVTRSEKSNNFLDALTVSNDTKDTFYNLSPNFTKDRLTYVVFLPRDVHSVHIEASFEDSLRVDGLGDININEFPYVHEIRVLDEKNASRSYFITFLQEASEVVTLANLSTSEGALDPVFDANRFVYNVDVDYDVTEIELFYQTNADDQIVEGAGKHTLKPGRNEFQVKVISGDVSQIYTVFVTRAKVSTPGLDWLEVSEGTLSPEFNSKQKTYHVVVDEDVEEITINAGSYSEEVEINGGGHKVLDLGHNLFEITVDAGAGKVETYYVVINRGEVDNLLLAHLSIPNEDMNEEFDPLVLSYTADLKLSSYDVLQINAIAQNPNATVSIVGNTDLGMGESLITVRVSISETEFADTTIKVTVGMRLLESDIHEVGDLYIATVKNEQTVLDLMNQMLNENSYLRVYSEGVQLAESDYVGTGAIIKLVIDDVEYDSKIIIILGDVNGDSEITVADIMMTQSKILGSDLTDIQMIAADVNKDDDVTVADFMMIQAHILTQIDIHGNTEVTGDE